MKTDLTNTVVYTPVNGGKVYYRIRYDDGDTLKLEQINRYKQDCSDMVYNFNDIKKKRRIIIYYTGGEYDRKN